MSFRLKTILGVALIEALLLMILIWSSLDYLVRSNQEELTRRAITTSQLFAAMTKDAVLSTDLATLESAVEEIMKSPGIEYVRIKDQEQVLVERGADSYLNKAFEADLLFDLSGDGVFDIAADINEGDYSYGRVEIGLSVAKMTLLIADARNRFISIALIEMLLVAIFSYLLGSYLSRGLKKLGSAAETLRQGTLGAQIDISGSDELAMTAAAFNEMSSKLQESHQEMQRSMHESEALAGQLRQSELRLRTILDSAVDGFVTIDEYGQINDINPAGANIFAYKRDELIGKNVSCLMPEPYQSEHDGYLINYLTGGDAKVIGIGREVEGMRKDGSTFPLDLSVSEMLLDNHKKMFVGLVRDITERREIEKNARTSDAIKSAVVESSLDALITINSDGNVVDFSPAAIEIFGYDREKVLGQPMDELIIPPALRDAHNKGMQRFFDTGEGPVIGNRIEVTAMRNDQSEFPAELTISVLQVENKTMFTAFIRDISERKNAELQLKEAKLKAEAASKAKSQFLAHMSHEIRSPLNAVLGSLGLILDSRLDQEQRLYARTAQTSGKALLAVINDILDFSKIEAGEFKLEESKLNLRELIVSIGEVISYRVHDKDVDLLSIIGRDIPEELLGDVTRIRQVLLNLMDNAIKFTDKGAVVLSVEKTSMSNKMIGLRIKVEDSGIGIPVEAQTRLFDEFSQVDSTDATHHGGTGLGLAICRKIIEMMDGRISVDSQPEKGSCFTIDLDLPMAGHETPFIITDHFDYRVLIVGLHPLARMALGKQLEALGCQVILVASGREALKKLDSTEDECFAFMLVDESIGDIDFSMLTQRAHTEGCEKLILITSLSPGEANQYVRDNYFDKPLFKPLHIDAVLSMFNEDMTEKDPTIQVIPSLQQKLALILQGKKLLLVEDSPANQMVATAILHKAGCMVDVANNGCEAIDAFRNINYDLILMDLRMPEMDGLEATGHIRSMPNGKNIPIIAMTANAMKIDIDRCLNAGMNDYISKPVDRDTLLRTIAKWLQDISLPTKTELINENIDGDKELMDIAALTRLAHDTSAEMLPTMVSMFLEEVSMRAEKIEHGITVLSLEQLCDEAHTIKSIAGTFGALKLQELAQDMETSCREDRRDEAVRLAHLLPGLWHKTLPLYRNEIKDR